MFSPLEQFDFFFMFGMMFMYLKISNLLLPFLFIFLYFCFFFNTLYFFSKVFQKFLEFIYLFLFDIIRRQAGSRGYKFILLVFFLFFFILFCNFLSLSPFAVALTSQIILIFLLTFTLSLAIFFIGLFLQGVSFFFIFVPKSPLLLLFLLVPIEIFSYFIRALSMAIRLSANIIAGHTLVFIISTFLLIIFTFNFIFFF